MSPSLIHPIFLQKAEQSKDKMAGKIKHKSNKESQSEAVTAIFVPSSILFSQPVYTPIGPTKPQVPMPEVTAGPLFSK